MSEPTVGDDARTDKPPYIFIVYADHDYALAKALKELLDSWGFEAFFCRQEDRDLATSETYRKDLAGKLAEADLVILLLTNAFKYSQYCQAEAGATVTLEKHHIQMMIPPVTVKQIRDISPVLEGRQVVDCGRQDGVIKELRGRLHHEFRERGFPGQRSMDLSADAENAFLTALAKDIEQYSIEPPEQALISAWPSLTDPAIKRSIIEHLRRAVADGTTSLAVVGVSLKYSIEIIGQAIDELARPPGTLEGPLTIELVHMDDQSQILHSLNDAADIDSVQKLLRINWRHTKESWEQRGKEIGLDIVVAEPMAIDYIPQQVGVRIASTRHRYPLWSVLYAGRCSFEHAGEGTRLMVGEREYSFCTSDNPRGRDAIAVFDGYFAQYRTPKHNGAALVPDRYQWIKRLEECVAKYPDISQLTLVSNTCQKLFPLIIPALRRGITVKVYVTDHENLEGINKMMVSALDGRLAEEIVSKLGDKCPGQAELYYLHYQPTFRAALIGESVLGLQAYIGQQAISHTRPLDPAELRLIITRYSRNFSELREVVSRMLQGARADDEPYAVLPAPSHRAGS
ncbi:MAG TPA: toll/interleukin-1 receptor domain-containing protein [Streptosporangiaceae bacterium]|nr:toll/interleukin-1 receptor domain-containing protein [Streptosporangiaceae bacterium]